MTKEELLEHIEQSIAPPSPFDEFEEEDYFEGGLIDRMREEWFKQYKKEEVLEPLIDLIIEQPQQTSVVRKQLFNLEVTEFTAYYKNTIYAKQLFNTIVSVLKIPQKRLLIIQVLGEIGVEDAIPYLLNLQTEELSDNELEWIACAIGLIGGKNAEKALSDMKIKIPSEKVSVHEQIDIALNSII